MSEITSQREKMLELLLSEYQINAAIYKKALEAIARLGKPQFGYRTENEKFAIYLAQQALTQRVEARGEAT